MLGTKNIILYLARAPQPNASPVIVHQKYFVEFIAWIKEYIPIDQKIKRGVSGVVIKPMEVPAGVKFNIATAQKPACEFEKISRQILKTKKLANSNPRIEGSLIDRTLLPKIKLKNEMIYATIGG